ncbi:MAG: hypothetical protein R3F36_15975 [Candidatus Competibacteraceae bacterium]
MRSSAWKTRSSCCVTALRERWRILIVADFDADGATSCALALRALRAMGAAWVGYRVPNRFEHGYGLTPKSWRSPPRSSLIY